MKSLQAITVTYATLLWMSIGLSGLASVDASTGPSQPPPGFAETVDVHVVDVEAVVTHKGKRVHGLRSENFELLIDGAPTDIEFFAEIQSGRVAHKSSGSLASGTDEASIPTYYLIFIDDYFSLPNRRDRALQSLEKQISQLGPQDRMAVVAYDGKIVEMLGSWQRDEQELKATLARATQRPAYGLQRRSEWQQTLSRLQHRGPRSSAASFAGMGFSGAGPGLRQGHRSLELETELAAKISRVADAAASTLRAFAGPPGRRVMLMYSGGLPGLGSYNLTHRAGLFENLDRFNTTQDARRLLSPVVEAANLLGYTLYPVDIGGLNSRFGGAEVSSAREAQRRQDYELQREFASEDSLFFLADETGGLPIFRGASHHVLSQVAEDSGTYYSIGFTPGWQAADRPHKIELKLQNKAGRVRSRRSFSDLSRASLMSFRVESAHQFDVPLPRAGSLSAVFGTPSPAGIGRVLVPLEIQIPTRDLALMPTANGLQTRLELRIAASDDRGRRADLGVIPVELSFAHAGAVAKSTPWKTTLKLRKRDHRLLLALYDPLGDVLLSHRVELDL